MSHTGTAWELPPLILHPFTEQGSAPTGRDSVLAARFAEMRMLYFVGKDLFRWIGQCMEVVERTPELAAMGIREQSFALLVAENPPESMRQKLCAWGVVESSAIFRRAMALNRVFAQPPAFEQLHEDFVRHYYRYADAVFACYRRPAFPEIDPADFSFALYASGEYLRMLEDEWGTSAL